MANLQARGTTPDAWQQAIAAFHETSSACVLSVTGGGASAIARLLEVPGASHTILEAIVPYAPAALDSWLARPPEQYCSRETALAMSAAAYARAERLSGKPADSARSIESGAEPQRRLLGIGCTASLVSSRPKRGDHRVHLAVHSSDATAWVSVTLAKGARDRGAEELLAGQQLLQLLLVEAGVSLVPPPDTRAEDQCLSGRQTANELLRALLLGDARVVWRTPAGEFQREFAPGGRHLQGLLSGSFNPRHDGHTQLREVAERQLKGTVAYEISIRNVDKPPLDYVSLEARAAQFADAPLAFTNAPTFVEKSRVFPGCAFVVGTDTAERLVDPKYYGGDQQRMLSALAEIAQSGCRFLVAGRKADDRFESLADLTLPAAFAPLFTGISEQEFRVDRSSTEIRKSASSSD